MRATPIHTTGGGRIALVDRASLETGRVGYRFDGFELDPSYGRLLQNGEPVRLDPTPFALLEALVRRAGRVVSKEEFFTEVWPDAVVSEDALKSCVRHVRRALGDNARSPRLVVTVRGRGYRLAQPISQCLLDVQPGGTLAGRLPFVGRRALLEVCGARLGEGGIVLLTGEPGIGKSRLLAELASDAAERGVSVLSLRPVASHDAPPFWPWRDALRRFARSDAAGFDRRIRGLEPALQPFLAGDLEPGIREPAPGTSRLTRFDHFEAVATLLNRIAEANPLHLTFDDLQDADADSLALLVHVGQHLEDAPLSIAATARTAAAEADPLLAPALRELTRTDRLLALPVPGLNAGEVTDLLLACGRALENREVQQLVARTGGNPLFLRELLSIDPDADLLRALPPGVRELIAERLTALPEAVRAALEPLALLGGQGSLAVLARACDRTVADLEAALEEARSAGVPVEAADGQARFDHALFGEALAAGLAPSQRAALARRLGEALEAQLGGAPGARVVELARLFQQAATGPEAAASIHEKAARYALDAARVALERTAHEESAAWTARALERFPDAGLAGTRYHGETLLGLATLHRQARRFESSRTLIRQAIDLARARNDALLLADATLRGAYASRGDPEWIGRYEEALRALGDASPPHRVRLLGRLASMLFYTGETARMDALSQESLAIAESTGDDEVLADACLLRTFACLRPDRLEERRSALRRAIAVFDRGDPALAWNARFYLIGAELEAGDLDSADVLREELAQRIRRLGLPEHYVRSTACTRALFAGRYAEAERLLLEGGALADPEEPNLFVFAGTMFSELRLQQGRLAEVEPVRTALHSQGRGYADVPAVRAYFALVDLEAGREDEARATLDALAANDFADLPQDFHLHTTCSYLVEICYALGDSDRAAQLYEILAPYPDRNVVFNFGVICRGSVSHYLGLAAETLGDPDRAVVHYGDAIEAHTRWGSTPYLAHTQAALGALLARRGCAGDRARAARLTEKARASAERLGVGLLLQRLER